MIELVSDPQTWAALLALTVMEIVLGVDNLIFISIVAAKLPERRQALARRVGIGLALVLRLAFLAGLAWIVGLTQPVFDLGVTGPIGEYGAPLFETDFSWRDLILIAGGAFLVWKATAEIHHKVDPKPTAGLFDARAGATGLAGVILQIVVLDIVFSIDSILTAIGMTEILPVMITAVVIAVLVMFIAAGPVSRFVDANPAVVMVALAFLLLIGMVLIADGLGFHIPKGYIYAAMAFAALVELLNMAARRRAARRGAEAAESSH